MYNFDSPRNQSRAAARVQVVVVDERGELAVDGVFNRRVHRTVDVSRKLGDQPGLHLGPESLVGVAADAGRVADLELGDSALKTLTRPGIV